MYRCIVVGVLRYNNGSVSYQQETVMTQLTDNADGGSVSQVPKLPAKKTHK